GRVPTHQPPAPKTDRAEEWRLPPPSPPRPALSSRRGLWLPRAWEERWPPPQEQPPLPLAAPPSPHAGPPPGGPWPSSRQSAAHDARERREARARDLATRC